MEILLDTSVPVFAWLILRIVYAWMFLYPLKALLKDWPGALGLTQLVIPFAAPLFTVAMLLTMFFSGLSILLGFYGQLAGFALLVYCLIGALVHYRLASKLQTISLSGQSSSEDKQLLTQAIQLGSVGHVTSAQKNFVLAAVACFFMLIGTGPYSLTGPFF